MSTIALRAAGLIASAVEPKPGKGLIQRLLEAQENEARRRVVGYLAAMDDGRLLGLGFSAEDIAALRKGEMRLPK